MPHPRRHQIAVSPHVGGVDLHRAQVRMATDVDQGTTGFDDG
jgi:hypothetical protein